MTNKIFPDTYSYPAIFSYADDGISIEFPDLPGCLPCAHSQADAEKNAQEAMMLHLFGMEQEGYDIPTPTPIEMLQCKNGQVAKLITAYMPHIRPYVERTVRLSRSLSVKAEYAHIDLSQFLQERLQDYLATN